MPANNLSAALLAAADGIRNKELERQRASQFLAGIKGVPAASVLKGFAEDSLLFIPVAKGDFTGKLVGVDGGMLKEQYHGLDLILLRAVGVYFEYSGGKLAKHAYYPSENPAPEPTTILDAESEMDFLLAANILRPKREFETALEAVRKFRPDALIMHGSIVPHPANRAGEGSPLRKTYLEMLQAYRALYEFCLKEGILLLGVVEDSRDNGFYSGIRDAPPTNCRDTAILFDALAEGERTCALGHAGTSQLGEGGLGKLARQVHSFYLKAVEFDRPLKVDFLSEEGKVAETAARVAALVYNTSRFNRSYALPTVTIEADARAKLKEEDLELLFQQISDRAGASPLSLALRRKQRPF